MLNLISKSTFTTRDGLVWDYYGDDSNNAIFYVVPLPAFARDDSGRPVFSLIEYASDDPERSGDGWCVITTQLSVPAADLNELIEHIARQHPGITPQVNTLEFKSGGRAMLSYVADDGSVASHAYATPSGFGSDHASFLLPLSSAAMHLFKATFGGTGSLGAVQITYEVSVPARLPNVTVTVQFDSAIAYEYQRTHSAR